MADMPAYRKERSRLGAGGAFLALLLLAGAGSWAQSAALPSAPNSAAPSTASGGASLESGIRALIAEDLYPGETIEGLTVVPEPEQSRTVARWEAHLVDDGRHFHPLFHPPTIILYQVLPGKAHFPSQGTALSPKADAAEEFRIWQKKLALTRSLMRQVVVLRCMLYCRHQMDALDQDNLKAAEQELSALTERPAHPAPSPGKDSHPR